MKTDSNDFPSTGFVRIDALVGPGRPIPFSRSSLWAMVAEGRFPPPVKLSARVTAWRVEDVRAYIADPEGWREPRR
jgi:prophage regulatory protein